MADTISVKGIRARGRHGVLSFERDAGFRCLVNVSSGPVPLPIESVVLLRSDAGGAPSDPLPTNAALWLVARTRGDDS